MKKFYLNLFILSFFASTDLLASHNYAGEIVVRQIDNLTVEASIITYSEDDNQPDRDSLYIDWGDGNIELIPRVNGFDQNGEPIENGMKRNIYLGTHSYSEIDTYLLSMTDPNRIVGILNINPPNSDAIPFHVQSEFTLVEMTSGTINTSPVFLEAPVDIAYVGVPFVHVVNAFDPDGDSLTYELTIPLMDVNTEVINFNSPMSFPVGVENVMTLDTHTGKMTWDFPHIPGLYVIAIKVISYRNGQETGSVIRDMIISVRQDEELASMITFTGAEQDVITPVSLGDTVNIAFDISEPDTDQQLFITSTCGLYDFYNNTATFSQTTNGTNGTANFQWIVKEEHLRQFPYQLVIQAVGSEEADALAAFAVFRFRTTDFVSETKEVILQNDYKIYPNPTSDYFIFEGNFNYPLPYQLISGNGTLVQKGLIQEDKEKISIADLPKGWYILQITSKENTPLQQPILIQD
ncbi:MAG: T9SS type A sorting domain-containing protein [Saprospiraceae bacterium]